MHTTSPSPTDEGSSRVALRFFFKQKTAYEIIGVTGVQTCALPISTEFETRYTLAFVRAVLPPAPARVLEVGCGGGELAAALADGGYTVVALDADTGRVEAARSSEERRVGKECRSRGSPHHYKKQK